MKNQRLGFTLVELMIVVAIIGILAAIAVPNYQKYQAKARQAEVKLNLAAAHTALTAFFTENSTYTQCLGSIGVGTATGKQYYAFGFNNAAAATCGPTGGTSCLAYAWNATGAAANCAAGVGSEFFNATAMVATGASGGSAAVGTDIPGVTNASSTAFTIGAAGKISSGGGFDTWTIDNAKTLVNTNSGL